MKFIQYYFPNLYELTLKLLHGSNLKKRYEYISKNIGGRLLDVGCAFGLLLKEASPFFSELYGYDISEFAINKAKKIIPTANLKVVDIESELPCPNGFFDCITALDVLEHTRDFEKSFEKITSKLKKGGYLIVSMPIDSFVRKIFKKIKIYFMISESMPNTNEYYKVYDKNYFSGKNSFFYKFGYKNSIKVWKSRLTTLLKYKKRGRLLDVGCALGFMLVPFSKYFEIYGIDCSAYAINKAKQNVKKGIFKVHNAEDPFPFKNNTFDVVTCMDVLEHLKKPDDILKNIFNALKKEGILFLTTPNNNVIRKSLFYFPDKLEHHISLHHVDDLIKKLEGKNFEILEYSTGIDVFEKSFWFKNKLGVETLVIARKV